MDFDYPRLVPVLVETERMRETGTDASGVRAA